MTTVYTNETNLSFWLRLCRARIDVPPLRERLSDIPELAQHFLVAADRSQTYQAQTISQAALAALCQHNWPGNVGELQNAIERALTVCNEEEIQPAHLPPAVLRRATITIHTNGRSENQNMIEAVEQFERGMILAALEKCYWNKTQAATALGVTRRILAYKMQNLGIEKSENPEREL